MNSLEKDMLNILAGLSNESQDRLIKVAIDMLSSEKVEKYKEKLKNIK